MIGIKFSENVNDGKHRIILIHNFPEQIPQNEKNSNYLEVSEIPNFPEQDNKDMFLVVNPITKEISPDYVDRPLTLEDLVKAQAQNVEVLKSENELMKLMIAELGLQIGGGL